jgi:hypothetical protein
MKALSTAHAVRAINAAAANRLTTIAAQTDELDGEANLTFDGSTLAVTGAITSSSTVTCTGVTIGSAVITEAELEILDGATLSTTELNYVDGVTSSIQTQLDAKQAADADLTALSSCESGAAAALALLTSTEVAILDGATLSTTELNYVDGVTSAIQTQLDAKQAADADLTALASCQTGGAAALALLTSTEIAILDGASLSTAELNYVDGVTSSVQTQLDGKSPVAGHSSIATVGTIGTGTWQGTALANDYVAALPTSKITTGTMADARIAASNVTQHQASITGSGALDSGTITANFGTIDNGSSTITTTGNLTAGDITATGGDLAFGSGQNATCTVTTTSGTNTAGRQLTIGAGLGTGTGAPGEVVITAGIPTSSGSNAHSATPIASFGTFGPTFNYGGVDNLADNEAVGDKVFFGTGQTVKGKLYYLDTNGAWVLADADAEVSTASLLAVACGGDGSGNAHDAATNGMLIRGFVDNAGFVDGTWDQGDPVYVSLTAGQMTFTRPSAGGDFVRCIGFACATSAVIYFAPDNTWLEL